jgi:hypothetical protein
MKRQNLYHSFKTNENDFKKLIIKLNFELLFFIKTNINRQLTESNKLYKLI